MLHTKQNQRILIERDEHGLKVVLSDYGDKDYLEDRLVEDFGIGDLWFSSVGEGDDELFVIRFPGREDEAALQKILDAIE